MQNTMGYKGYVSYFNKSGVPGALIPTNTIPQGMFFMFGSFDVLMFLFVFFFVPETKGLSLEKMDELFGMTETVKQLDAEPETGRPISIHEDRATKS